MRQKLVKNWGKTELKLRILNKIWVKRSQSKAVNFKRENEKCLEMEPKRLESFINDLDCVCIKALLDFGRKFRYPWQMCFGMPTVILSPILWREMDDFTI